MSKIIQFKIYSLDTQKETNQTSCSTWSTDMSGKKKTELRD